MKRTSAKAKNRRSIPTKKEIRRHIKCHAQIQSVFKRIINDLQRVQPDVSDNTTTGTSSRQISIVEIAIELMSNCLAIVEACDAIYSAMASTLETLETPGVPQATRDKLNKNLDELIESAANLGCPS